MYLKLKEKQHVQKSCRCINPTPGNNRGRNLHLQKYKGVDPEKLRLLEDYESKRSLDILNELLRERDEKGYRYAGLAAQATALMQLE